jgi:hypothetical protein
LVAQRDVVLGQRLEALVIADLLLDLRGLLGGDALGKLFTVEEALEHEIGAAFGFGSALGASKELLAQGTAAQAINGLHFLQHGGAFLDQGLDWSVHAE